MQQESKKPFFGLDCLFMQDPKTRRMLRKHSHEGVLAFLAILGRTYYENRAYSVADENFVFAVSEDLYIDEDELRKIIDSACSLGLFDERIYKEQNILTSVAMQRRFCDEQVARRRMKIEIPEEIRLDNEYIENSKLKLIQRQQRNSAHNQQIAENKVGNSENEAGNSENKAGNVAKVGVLSFPEEIRGEEIRGGINNITENSSSSFCQEPKSVRPASGSPKKEKKEEFLNFDFDEACASYSEEVTNEEYLMIVRRMMRSGAARPCDEANEYIKRWSANGWRNKFGLTLNKVTAANQWEVRGERKITQGGNPWMATQYKQAIDEWLIIASMLFMRQDLINAFRGLKHEEDRLVFVLDSKKSMAGLEQCLYEHVDKWHNRYGEVKIEYRIPT